MFLVHVMRRSSGNKQWIYYTWHRVENLGIQCMGWERIERKLRCNAQKNRRVTFRIMTIFQWVHKKICSFCTSSHSLHFYLLSHTHTELLLSVGNVSIYVCMASLKARTYASIGFVVWQHCHFHSEPDCMLNRSDIKYELRLTQKCIALKQQTHIDPMHMTTTTQIRTNRYFYFRFCRTNVNTKLIV